MTGPASVSLDFTMPSLGADMDAGKVTEWRVKPGDVITRGEIIAEIETDKGTFEVECPHDGRVAELVVTLGSKVAVGTVLARLVPAGAAVGSPVAPSVPVSDAQPPSRIRASPAARALAARLGVDLGAVSPTGPEGAVTLTDVERAHAGTGAPPPSAATSMRRAIAAAVSRSKREIPHYYLASDIDVTPMLAWLEARNAQRPVADRVLPAAPMLRAAALALRRYPDLNGFWENDGFHPGSAINLGVAITLRTGGLVAPAIHDADARGVDDLMTALRDLVLRARSGGLRGSEMTDATVTVTSLGDEGASTVFGVIYPPQVAIIGLGGIVERPWAEQGVVSARRVLTATLAADHRATDGHYGGQFLAELARLLESPESL